MLYVVLEALVLTLWLAGFILIERVGRDPDSYRQILASALFAVLSVAAAMTLDAVIPPRSAVPAEAVTRGPIPQSPAILAPLDTPDAGYGVEDFQFSFH